MEQTISNVPSNTNDQVIFAMYFGSIAAMQFHPRASLKGAKVMNLEQCRTTALMMLLMHQDIFKGD